jgi:hypothetical protein
MIVTATRTIAIDDRLDHLEGLTKGLTRLGVACLPIHFKGRTFARIKACPFVRVIFADLNLIQSGASDDHTSHFSAIGRLLQKIKPKGPYLLILWTQYPDQADSLATFLQTRVTDIPQPLLVTALDKKEYLLNDKRRASNTTRLVSRIRSILGTHPQVAALLNWEERVLDAAADSVSSIVDLASTGAAPASRPNHVGRILARLATEAVGEGHVEKDRFAAVNEALLPILADRLSLLRSRGADAKIWKRAFSLSDGKGGMTANEAAKLNGFLHVATEERKGIDRGAVIVLPKSYGGVKFEYFFGLPERALASKEFFSAIPEATTPRWMLVQTQAACDYVQGNAGLLPFYLGLEVDPGFKRKDGKPPAALWESPVLSISGAPKRLFVSARFALALPSKFVARQGAVYRLRDQLLGHLTYAMYAHASRPGIVSTFEMKPKQAMATPTPPPSKPKQPPS